MRGLLLWLGASLLLWGKQCYNAHVIITLPFFQKSLSTCGAGNHYTQFSPYMSGEDYVFVYTPTTTKVLQITLTNTAPWCGVFVVENCPDDPNAQLVAKAESPSGNPQLKNVVLHAYRTYYIIVDTWSQPSCTPFAIAIEEVTSAKVNGPLQVYIDTWINIINRLVDSTVSVVSVVPDCPSQAFGWFVGGGIGLDSGLIMTTGRAIDAQGPNNSCCTTTNLFAPGDPDINAIVAPFISYDACAVTITLVPKGDTLRFRYVFASEEYEEYVCCEYNDAFAFFISGPGIPGKQNMALLPGTNTPITIQNVNADVNGDCARYCSSSACCNSNAVYYTDNYGGPWVEYDGILVPLIAQYPVIPFQTYTLKLVIADVGDALWDSGVFIQHESISSTVLPLRFVRIRGKRNDQGITIYGYLSNTVAFPITLYLQRSDAPNRAFITLQEQVLQQGTTFTMEDVYAEAGRDYYYRVLLKDAQGAVLYSNVLFMDDVRSWISVVEKAGVLQVVFDETFEGEATYNIYDLWGQVVRKGRITKREDEISLKTLAAGMYWIEVFYRGKRYVKRFLL